MKFAAQILNNGETVIVDATGKKLGNSDVDRPMLHVLPKLFLPEEAVETDSLTYLKLNHVTLNVTSTLPIDIIPDGGVIIRQPYPNQRYLIGGSNLIRNGWLIPLPNDVTEFNITFQWKFNGPWFLFGCDEWEVSHSIQIKLQPGDGKTYSMDGSCWQNKDTDEVFLSPVSTLGSRGHNYVEKARRNILDESLLEYDDGYPAGYFIEELVNIKGIKFDQAWTIDAFQDEQLHEVEQVSLFNLNNQDHYINGPIEMPIEKFIEAVKLAEEIEFDTESKFRKSIEGIPGGMETHPALKCLCQWWETIRPVGEKFKPGSAMPLVRVRDDGEYWWGYYETPNSTINGFNKSGRDAARIGDTILMLFQATQNSAIFNDEGMKITTPSGEPICTVGVDIEDYLSGTTDEAWYSLVALANFRDRFPVAWKYLNTLNNPSSPRRKLK